jgi:type II secretory ATPase GspE/PulE/Tfp pilus assembly ATPase PilB-like protein
MNAPKRPRRLGEILVEEGLITQDQLRIALTEQKKTKQPLGKVFVALGFVTEAVMRDALGEASGSETVDLSHVVVDPEAIALIPKDVAQRYSLLPITLNKEQGLLTVAMADIFNVVALDQINALLGGRVELKPLATSESELHHAIDQFYGFELSVDGILQELETGEVDRAALQVEGGGYSQPLVRLVDALISDAVKRSASDIHFEPELGFLRIRYRIDGVLRQVRIIHINYWQGMVVRLKVMANMNIAETRAPQDGRISLNVSGRVVDFRVASHPTAHGENFVLRILDRQKGIVPLDKIGLPIEALTALRLMMARPEGMILVTGPTGSGKTTTLYSMLNAINTESVNIMTLEDPVEYPMGMIRQTSVGDAVKLDYASGIRSLMRQDPDIILVGEIRDEDTAEMALRAAMTGHQVYSTLHTNSALGVIARLLDIGIKADILAGNIIGVVAQRLVRKLCAHCKQAYRPSEVELQLLGRTAHNEQADLYRAGGCEKCEQTGYKGRMALLEILRFDAELDELVARRGTLRELEAVAKRKGFKTLADDGARRVWEGITSIDEVSRVVDLTARLG